MQMKFRRGLLRPGALAVGIAAIACAAAALAATHMPPGSAGAAAMAGLMDICTTRDPAEAGFAAENDAAMTKMMAGMNIKPSGDIDRDFADMMIAHHQGAIEMAEAVLERSSNATVQTFATSVVLSQQSEIDLMTGMLADRS